ncbi:hypothetical protein BU14_0965s0002 [Porphyra umbilicalis]|uniref:Uncharacterized protein n=1 Tax=Porphyra umbilicalis TaxID=2786 RepID=A0A1X6NN21_PORUM|nr:hypothetical protein BU14_0965s0002 [Porphyra umbilicalis]|eukprot:OSX69988.1 hypothetical protein BU14_0965s0002 [Porphyra umbilicalis]
MSTSWMRAVGAGSGGRGAPAPDDPTFLALILDVTPHAYAARSTHPPADALRHVVEAAVAFASTFLLLHPLNRLAVVLTSPHRTAVVYPPRGGGAASGGSDAVHFYEPPLPPPPPRAVGKKAAASPPPPVAQPPPSARDVRGAVVAGVTAAMAAAAAAATPSSPPDGGGGGGGGGVDGGGGSGGRPAAPRLAAALSLALCTANRARAGYDGTMNAGVVAGGVRRSLQARLAVLAAAPDAPDAYVAVMNAAFAAARADVRVDAVLVGGGAGATDSTFLQQAAYLTKGVYRRLGRGGGGREPPVDGGAAAPPPAAAGGKEAEGEEEEEEEDLLTVLLTLLLPDAAARAAVAMPEQASVDLRASCFATRRRMDMGWACSVCLATYSVAAPTCETCGAVFRGGGGVGVGG